MPWNAHRHPNSTTRPPPLARRKAIAIANRLTKQGCDKRRSIRTAIWRARSARLERIAGNTRARR